MCGIIGDVDVLVCTKPIWVVEAFVDEFGHGFEDSEGGEFGVVWLRHGDAPEAAQD